MLLMRNFADIYTKIRKLWRTNYIIKTINLNF